MQKITVTCRPDNTCQANTLTGQVSIPTPDEVRKTPGLAETLVRMVEQAITVPVQSKMRAAARKLDKVAADKTYESAKATLSKEAIKAAFDACVAFDWSKVGLIQRGPVGKSVCQRAADKVIGLINAGKLDRNATKTARMHAHEAYDNGEYAKVKELLAALHPEVAEVFEPKEEEKE